MSHADCRSLVDRLADEPVAGANAGIAPTIYRLIDWLHAARWSSAQARERGLRRLIVAARGSRGVVDEREFARRAARLAIQWGLPAALRGKMKRHERVLNAAASADGAIHAANAIAYYAAAAAAAGPGVRDDALAAFAERVVCILRDLHAPGAACLTDCDAPHSTGA